MSDLPNLAKSDYIARINRAIDLVIQNLDEPLKLESVAEAACFSPFHFHRIFSKIMGETLNAFIKRQRLERALYYLSHQPTSTLTEIAYRCGFSSSSDFSRSFRVRFGVPPSAFDLETFRQSRRDELEAAMTPPGKSPLIERLPKGENPDGFEVSLHDVPARWVVYIRVRRPYEEGRVSHAAERLAEWAERRDLADGQWLGYMWEDPEITPLEQCRYDVGLEIPEQLATDGDIGLLEFPEMKLAQIDLAGPIDLEQRAIDWIYGTWLPQSGYSPDDQPAFEAWNGRPFEHGLEHFELKLQLPVVRSL